jgi:hypothetical protein
MQTAAALSDESTKQQVAAVFANKIVGNYSRHCPTNSVHELLNTSFAAGPTPAFLK